MVTPFCDAEPDIDKYLAVQVIDRVLYKLDELVRPYVHKILVVIEPLLIDEDYYARVEGREIIANLSKAAGLATMIAAMRPDIDNIDEYVRNTTARAFSVVASALGIPALLPFLKAVCLSKKSWQARHTGIKIVQQISILLGCAVLPHLKVSSQAQLLMLASFLAPTRTLPFASTLLVKDCPLGLYQLSGGFGLLARADATGLSRQLGKHCLVQAMCCLVKQFSV